MPEIKCFYCEKPKLFTIYKVVLCSDCYKQVCHFCSDKAEKIVFKSKCPGHIMTTSTRNRFMEDTPFVKNGGFDLESE